MGVFAGCAYGPLFASALNRVEPRDAADASGVMVTVIQLGQVVGVAAFGTLFLDALSPQRPEPARPGTPSRSPRSAWPPRPRPPRRSPRYDPATPRSERPDEDLRRRRSPPGSGLQPSETVISEDGWGPVQRDGCFEKIRSFEKMTR